MAQINTDIFLEKSSQKCDDVDFEMDDEFAGFLEQLEAIPIELADENCASNYVEEIETVSSGKFVTVTETDNVLQKDISEEKKKELLALSDSLESGECCSSEYESLDSKAGLLKGRSLYQQVLDFKAERSKKMHKFEVSSAETNEKNELMLPGKARSRKDSSSSYSSSLSGKETVILPLNYNLPRIALETDILEEKLESRNLAASPPLEFEDCLGSNPLLKEKTPSSFHKHVKQEMMLFENKLSPISLYGSDNVHNFLKAPDTMKNSTKARTLSEDKDISSVSIIQSVSAALDTKLEAKTELNESIIDCKAEISNKKSPFSPISNSSSSKLEKKDMLSLSSISPPTEQNDPLAQGLNATPSKSLIIQREIKDYDSLSPASSNVIKFNSSKEKKEKKVKKKKRKNLKRKARSKSKSRENEKPSGKRKTRSRSRSIPVKESQSRSIERHSSSSIGRCSSSSIGRHSKSRSSSIERTAAKRRKQSFSRSQSRSRPTEKGRLERQRRYYRRSRSRSYEKGRNQSYRRSPSHYCSRSRSSSKEKQKVRKQRWYCRKSRSRSRSRERRRTKRSTRSMSRSPCRSICRSPKRKKSLSKTPPELRKTSSSMSISPLTSDENTIVTGMPANSEKQASLPYVDVNPPFSQPQPIPSVVGHVVQPQSSMGNHTNYYDNYCYSQDVPYVYPSNMHMPGTQPSYYHPPEQKYWNPESGLQDRFYYNQQAHYNQQANLTEIILSATVPPLPSTLPFVPPLPTSEPVPPPTPPPPESDSSRISTPEKAKPSKLITRLKSNLRYLLPAVTKKLHSEEVVKLIDRSLQSPQKVSPSVSSSSSLGEEMPKDRKEQVEKRILEKLQEVTFESTSPLKDHKPSSKPEVRQPVQLLAYNNTSSEEAHDNENNNNDMVDTQMIASIVSEQDTVNKQSKSYAVLKPKPNSKYSQVVLKLPPRQKLVPNSYFIDTESDQETTACDTNEHRVIKKCPFKPDNSSSRSSLILINTLRTLPSEEKHEQGYSVSMKICSPGLAKDTNKLKNNLTNNSKEKEIIKGADLESNSMKDDKSKSPHHIANDAFGSDNGNTALKNKTKMKLECVPQDKCKNHYKSKDFKSDTVTEIDVIFNNAGKDIHQSEHMAAFTGDANGMLSVSNTAENEISNYTSQSSEIDTSAVVYKDNVTTATMIRETNMFRKRKQKPVIERVFGTTASATVSNTVTKAEINIKCENVFQMTKAAVYTSNCSSNTTNATTIIQTNTAADRIAKISNSAIQREYGQNLGCSGTYVSVDANATAKAESMITCENTFQNSENVLQNTKASAVSHAESVTCELKIKNEVPVTKITSNNTNDTVTKGQVENETFDPLIQNVLENNFSNAVHKEEIQEVTTEVCVSDGNKQNQQHKINNKLKHTPNEAELSPTTTNKESQEESNAFTNKKEESTDLTQDVKTTVKRKTATCEQELSKSDYLMDLKQNSIKNPYSELPMQIKQERCASTERCCLVEVPNEKQAIGTDATFSQNFLKNEKVTSLEETDLKKMTNKIVVSELSHIEKATDQDSGAINTQLKNEAQGENKIIYKLVPDLPALSILKTETCSSTETKLSLPKHKNKNTVVEHHPVTKVDSLSTTQHLKPNVKVKEQQKKIYSDSVLVNTENFQHRSALLKGTGSGGDIVSNSASPPTLSNPHKSNAPGKKYQHRCHDKGQTYVLPQEAKVEEMKQNGAVSEKIDIDTAEGEKATGNPERLDASYERKNWLDIEGTGTKEAGDKLGESSKSKGYNMEHVGIAYKQREQKKKEQSTTVSSATVRLDHGKQIWEDPKLNMDVKIWLEKIIITEQPQNENEANKTSSCTVLSLPADIAVTPYTSKNTNFALVESKVIDSQRKSKSKKPKINTTKSTSSALKNLSNSISNHGSVKEQSKDLSEIKAVYDKKSKLSALEKVISVLTVPRRSVSTQVRVKYNRLQGTHEVKDHCAPIKVESAVISSLKEILKEYETRS